MTHPRILALLASLLCVATAAPAAPVASVFGGRIACSEQSGVQFCPGDVSTRIESWDGVPLDVSVTLPPASMDGPFPLIVDLHGWALFKSGSPFVDRANDGYVVLSYTARGFHASCGSVASRDPDPTLADPTVCAERGWIHLADARFEGRDTQYLAGLLADEGLVIPDRIGVTGVSYGGGQSMILAALRNRVMMPDGTLVPWQSSGGLDMAIAAAGPLIPWSDLAYSLVPNGRTLDYRTANPYGMRGGVQKVSWNRILYGAGLGTGFFAPVGVDPLADITGWDARIALGEPYDSDPQLSAILTEIADHHSAYYIDDSVEPAPLFIYNAWTDDLFPVDEALRFWRKTKSKYPQAEVALQFAAGFGHPRADLGASPARPEARVTELFAHHVKGTAGGPLPALETFTQGCNGVAEDGPFAAADWDALHPGEVLYRAHGIKRFTSAGGKPQNAAAVDPLAGGPCRTVPGEDDPGAATYRLPPAEGAGYTLLGSPTVIAELAVTSPAAQVDARLWDAAPTGMQTLVSHAVYRPRTDNAGRQVFQLHPNGWNFAAGHVPKLELLGQSSPYVRPSNGTFAVSVRRLELRLPVRETPAGTTIRAPAPPVSPPAAREAYGCGLAPLSGCRMATPPATSTLTIAIGVSGLRDRIAWRWTNGPATAVADFGDPAATTDYALCVYAGDGHLVLGAIAPAGGLWTATGSGLRYLDRSLDTGLGQVELTAGPAGGSSIRATGKGTHLGVPMLPAEPLPLTVQLAASDGSCWAATFETARPNTTRLVRARSP